MRALMSGALVALMATTAFAARHPDDAEDLSDPPGLDRFPGFYLTSGRLNEFDAHDFPTRQEPTPGTDDGQPTETKEGQFWELYYNAAEGTKGLSAIQLLRNYDNATKKAGGKALVMQTGNKWYRQMGVFVLPNGKSERWLYVEALHDTAYKINVVDVAAMEQKVALSAGEMADAIGKVGFVAVPGILFDTAKAEVKPESMPAIDEIVSLLKSNKALKVSIEGHTDNVGDKKANQTLSQKRAEAVMKVIASKGIDAKRLKAAGRGDTIPVADNRIEDGRALNRRVELVKF